MDKVFFPINFEENWVENFQFINVISIFKTCNFNRINTKNHINFFFFLEEKFILFIFYPFIDVQNALKKNSVLVVWYLVLETEISFQTRIAH